MNSTHPRMNQNGRLIVLVDFRKVAVCQRRGDTCHLAGNTGTRAFSPHQLNCSVCIVIKILGIIHNFNTRLRNEFLSTIFNRTPQVLLHHHFIMSVLQSVVATAKTLSPTCSPKLYVYKNSSGTYLQNVNVQTAESRRYQGNQISYLGIRGQLKTEGGRRSQYEEEDNKNESADT